MISIAEPRLRLRLKYPFKPIASSPKPYHYETFYQKHIGDEAPAAIRRFELKDGAAPEIYPYIEDLAGLIGLMQMGVLEIHPWGSRIEKLETPDRVTIDLDPDEDLPWERVTEAAIDVREA